MFLSIMNVCPLNKDPCVERLLGFKLTSDFKWNSYKKHNDAGTMVGSFFNTAIHVPAT